MGKKGNHPVEVTDHAKAAAAKIRVQHPGQCTVAVVADDKGLYRVFCLGGKHPQMLVTAKDKKALIEAGATECTPPKPEGGKLTSPGSWGRGTLTGG